MIRRATGGDENLAQTAGELRGEVQIGQVDPPFAEVHPTGNGIGQTAHLLVDFLLHEMTVFPLLRRDRVPRHRGRLDLHGFTVQSEDLHPLPGDDRHLTVLQEDHSSRVLQYGRQVRGHKHLILAKADDHPAGVPQARRHDLIRFTGGHHNHGVGAFHMLQGPPHGLDQSTLHAQQTLDQMGDHFGVGVRTERCTLGRQLFA